MRFVEFNGIHMPISNDENRIIDKIRTSENAYITSSDLNESDVELVRKMVSRGVIGRFSNDDMTYYAIDNYLKQPEQKIYGTIG